MGKTRKIYVCDDDGYASELALALMDKSTPFRVTPMPFDVFEFEIKEEIWDRWLSDAVTVYEIEQSPDRWEPKDDHGI